MIDFVTDQEKDYHYQSSISIKSLIFKPKTKKLKNKNEKFRREVSTGCPILLKGVYPVKKREYK